MIQPFPAPTFGHATEAFVIAHAAPGAWAEGTAVKYRQTLTALGGKLAEGDPAAAADIAVLGTLAGASALEAAFTAAFGGLAPATRARHLSALRSAIAWWTGAGWVTADPTAGWARPKVPVDTTRGGTGIRAKGAKEPLSSWPGWRKEPCSRPVGCSRPVLTG